MIQIRKAHERGHAQLGWLEAYYTFSFAGYYDPQFIHFRSLRVMNEDRVQAGKGFSTHHHDNMEIITLVLEGELEHRDSMGNQGVIRAGEVQRMAAGTGVEHSEFNKSASETLHLYQIWILPQKKGLPPEYDQKSFATEWNQKTFTKVLSGLVKEESTLFSPEPIEIFLGNSLNKKKLDYKINSGRSIWLQMVEGEAQLETHSLSSSDGVSVSKEEKIELNFLKPSRFFLIDLPS